MSLKHFHILFIILSVLTTVIFGLWALLMKGLPSGFKTMGTISLAGGILLFIYGIRFFIKAKKIIV